MRPHSISFDVDVETMLAQFLIQVRGMQCDLNLGNIYRHARFLHFYKLLCVISDHSQRMTSPSEARMFVKNYFQK
jgi:hypothetical protein